MVPLSKLRGIIVPEEYKHVYKHYLEQEMNQVKDAHQQLIGILDRCYANKKVRITNQQAHFHVSLEDFTSKAYNYFLKILYVIIHDNNSVGMGVSIKTCIKDANDYAIAEYLALNLVKSIS